MNNSATKSPILPCPSCDGDATDGPPYFCETCSGSGNLRCDVCGHADATVRVDEEQTAVCHACLVGGASMPLVATLRVAALRMLTIRTNAAESAYRKRICTRYGRCAACHGNTMLCEGLCFPCHCDAREVASVQPAHNPAWSAMVTDILGA